MFWGLILKANRKYTQTIKKSFHLSHAALDITSSSDGPVQLILTSDKNNYILCTLKKESIEQVALDLNFEEGEEISFTSQGEGNVHLSGYLVLDELDQFDEEEDMDLEEDSVEIKKDKKEKKKVEAKDEEDSDDSDDDDEDDELEDDSEEDESEDESEGAEADEPEAKQRKVETPTQNGVGKQPSSNKAAKKEVKLELAKGEKSLQGGVKIEDLRVGQGAEAKVGKKMQVYYIGKIKSTNRIFDSHKIGSGFKFVLGKGQVIKGWDVGVVGMKVGGKRRITCPPHMGYGSKGSPPVVPGNSTLVFDVELKAVL